MVATKTKRGAEDLDKAAGSKSKKAKRDDDEEDFEGQESSDSGVNADELAALDQTNVISTGRRTRGIRVDYTKVQQLPGDDDDEDEEEEEKPKRKKKPSAKSPKAPTKAKSKPAPGSSKPPSSKASTGSKTRATKKK